MHISGGRALSIGIVMTALAIMLMAGGVPHRFPLALAFLSMGALGVHSAENLSL